MTAVVVPDEEECRPCSKCGLRPRAGKGGNTWCRPCKNGWQRSYRDGAVLQERVPLPVRNESGCLIWQGYIDPEGYGRIKLDGDSRYVHREAYILYWGEIPDGLTVDHTCEVKACIEGTHLKLETRGRNTQLYYERRRAEVNA